MLEVVFLGTAPAVPEPGGESASLVVNSAVLVDTGWHAALRMSAFGLDPRKLTHLVFTHLHQDHYLGLPMLLFQRAMGKYEGQDPKPLVIAGPAGELERVWERTTAFLQADIEPAVLAPVTLVPLHQGDMLEAGDLRIVAGPAFHPVPALSFRITDTKTGAVLALTGDTRYHDTLIEHFQGADLLVAEATFGANPAPVENPFLHMGAPEAARLALAAGVRRLALTHGRKERREAAVAAAQGLFPRTFWPTDGERVAVVSS